MYFKWRHVSSGRKDDLTCKSNTWARISHPSKVKITRLSEEMTAFFFSLECLLFPKFDISNSAEAAALLHAENVQTCF